MLDVLYFWSIFHCKGSYDYLPFMAIAHQQDSRVSTVEACLAVGEYDSLSPSPLVLSHLVNHSKSNRLVRPVPSSIGRQTFRVPSILCLVLLRLCFSPTPPRSPAISHRLLSFHRINCAVPSSALVCFPSSVRALVSLIHALGFCSISSPGFYRLRLDIFQPRRPGQLF